MTTPPALDRPSSTLVTIDLPAIEAYAGRVDRLAAEVSLARSFAVTHGEARRPYAGEIVGWDSSAHDDVLDYVDGVLHLIAVAARELAEQLRDSRDAYAHSDGDSGSAAMEIWATDGGLGVGSVPRSTHLAPAAGEVRDERTARLAGGLERLGADCDSWAATLSDGQSALALSWTDPAAEHCAAYVRRVVELVTSAGAELSALGTGFGDSDNRVAA